MDSKTKKIRIPGTSANLINVINLICDLTVPKGATAIIVFAKGSGKYRRNLRHNYIAERLNRSGFATLLLDPLATERPSGDDTLSADLCAAVDWLSFNPETESLAVGLFGAGAGCAAALRCAAKRPLKIAAVVSSGGRPDLAAEALACVLCPALFLVGGFDPQVMALTEKAVHMMHCHREIEIIPGATHSFEEPGRLDLVATMATWWFARYCAGQFGPSAQSVKGRDVSNSQAGQPLVSFDSRAQHK